MPLLPDNTQPPRQIRQVHAIPQWAIRREPPQTPIPPRRNPDPNVAREAQPTRDTWCDKPIDLQSPSSEAAHQGLRRLSVELMDVIMEMGSLADAEYGQEAFDQLLERIRAVNQDALEFLRNM